LIEALSLNATLSRHMRLDGEALERLARSTL
jgi:hypothetical protein